VRASILDDRTYGTFGDAIERVHVRWTSGLSHGLFAEEFLKTLGEEFAGVIGV
jgi:hypothetical protein